MSEFDQLTRIKMQMKPLNPNSDEYKNLAKELKRLQGHAITVNRAFQRIGL